MAAYQYVYHMQGVSKTYPGGKKCFENIHLSFLPGVKIGVVGVNGSGKSTLMKIMAGLDTEYNGTVETPDAMAMVFQEPTLLPWRSALQNITLVSEASDAEANAAMGEVGLEGKQYLFPMQLSLGQRRRLALARAFAAKPKFLIMDEPFTSLDQERVTEMVSLSKKLISTHGVTTLFVTHSEDEASRLANRVLRIEGHPAHLLRA